MDNTETSPFGAHLGLELLDWGDGSGRIGYELVPAHVNRSNILHGGVLLMLLDEVGGLCGSWVPPGEERRRSVTVTLNASFTGQVASGRVVASGRRVSQGRSIFFVRSEVHDAAGTLVAFASSTHRWRSRTAQAGAPQAESISTDAPRSR